MKIYQNCKLDKYTTLGIGGVAKELIEPESVDELISVTNSQDKYFIGGGSNILISERYFERVISLRRFADYIVDLGNGTFLVGASVRLQKLIDYINDLGYGGIEYLYSVPGLVGGSVKMNAGLSATDGKTISDHIQEVHTVVHGQSKVFMHDECDFKHRHSFFSDNDDYIITEVVMSFAKQAHELSDSYKKERLEFCKKYQDCSGRTAGSVFSQSDSYIMELLRRIRIGKSHGVYYSKMTGNWLINDGKGTYNQAIFWINVTKLMHILLLKKSKLEIIIWK